jgi:NAD(P)-dependent dehydrogenase (short-subunit alcohol dehydrogenase family)
VEDVVLLERKNVVVHGGGGAIGGAVALAFAREGATVFLAGRTLDAAVAARVRADTGATVHVAQVDVLDEEAVEKHADTVVETGGSFDVSFNAVGHDHFQGIPLADLSGERFVGPFTARMTSQFLTARAAARRMTAQRSGVIMMITATPARMAVPLSGSFGAACAAMEGLSRSFAAELGPYGVRVVCLRSAGSPDAPGLSLAFEAQARGQGTTPEAVQAAVEETTMLRRLPRLADVGDVAAFMASDRARALTATVVNLTSGAIAD